MDSSSGSESLETLKLISHDVGGISPRDVELETMSIGSNGESLPRNYDGYAMQYEMDLFGKSQYSATTSSYSSSDKYSEDYFQVRPTDMTKIDKDVLDFLEDSNTATIAMSSSSTEPASMVSDITHESLMHGLTPARSPPQVQLMDRLGGYQPGRIPASVFETSPSSTPAEWSIASNDSLFSIHIGNISFTRDQFKLSEELRKSVEFAHFDEAVSTTQPQEYDDGPIAELEKNFQDNENATRMSISIKDKRDDPFATSTAPSVNDKQCVNLSKKKSSGSWCSCPNPEFKWLRKICCWSPACCHCLWPSCHCQCPILDWKCGCLTCCPSCCDWNCCSKECCSCCFGSKRSDTELKSCSSCCTCSGCCTLSSSCNLCCTSCFSCRRKSRCCC